MKTEAPRRVLLTLIELRLIYPLLTAILQAQPYLLFGGQFNPSPLIPLDEIQLVINGNLLA